MAIRPDINPRPNVDVRTNVDVRPGTNEVVEPSSGRTIADLDLSEVRQRRGRSGESGGGSRGGTAGGTGGSAGAGSNNDAELERLRREQERNENLRKDKDAKIAKQQQEKQQSRKQIPVIEASGFEMPDGSIRLSDSDVLRSLDGNASERTTPQERMQNADGIPTGRVLDQEWFDALDGSNSEDINSLNEFLMNEDEIDDYYKYASESDGTYSGSGAKARHMPEYDPMSDDVLQMYLNDPDSFPEGPAKRYLDAQARRRVAQGFREQAQMDALQERRDKAAADIRAREENVVKASEVGKRQRERYDEVVGNWDPDKPRYRTIDEIRDAASDLVRSNPGKYTFADDRVFEPVWYDERMSDEDIRKRITKDAGVMWSDINSEIDSRRNSRETSLAASRHGGAAEFDPDSTVAQNVINVENAVDGNARLIANPFLIKWGSESIEHVTSIGGSTFARFQFSNREGRDVQGAIGSVRRYYNCSTMSVMRLVIRQLGLGVDTKGEICGQKAEDFRLSDVLIIEACNDILNVAKQNGGIPTGINMMGKPGGYDNSRDDTGMFPILGGTRCMPMGHIPLDTFYDISGPGSPLYKMSADLFYQRNIESFVNDVQPHMLANSTGPRAFQAIAWNIANEGLLSIDGLPNDMYNIPEHQVYRTKAVLQADLMDTTDEQCREAKVQRLKNMQEIDSRMRRMYFKDGDSRSNSENENVPLGTLLGPGKEARQGPLSNVASTFTSIAGLSRSAVLGVLLTSPIESLASVGAQATTITAQKVGKKVAKSLYHLNENFDRTEFLDEAITSEDGLEAIEAYMTLFRAAGRTAVQEFMIDRADGNGGPRYKSATKANVYDFLQRWKVSQTPEVARKIENAIGFLMAGNGMLSKTKARQFLDMALIEMQNNRIHGGEVFNSDNLEEIAHSGEHRYGVGEALVSALMDTSAGYEAFKTIDYTSIDRTTPITRAMDVVLRKHGVTELAFRQTICMFPRFMMGRITRAVPGFCTISYMMSDLAKRAAVAERDAMSESYDPTNKLCQAFAKGFREAADAVSRISDYQVGMDSADYWVGLRKNMLYDASIFGANYIVQAVIKRGVIAMLGGLEPPEDEQKITLPWEWKTKLTGLPMKDAWFMDDLLGCGAPLAYAWEILDGYDVKDENGNVRHVEAYSEEAKKVAWQAYKNMIRNYGPTKDAIDAMEMITDFDDQIQEIMGKDIWRQTPAKSLEDFVGNIDKEMAEYYEGTDYDLSVDEMRRQWALGRFVGFAYDMFDELTPKIASQVLPYGRDSLVRDDYQHVTKMEYDLDNYDEKTAKDEYRVTKRPYVEWQMALRTRDNVVEAFLTDFATALFTDNQSNFSYMDMPIRTSTDPRPRSENNHMARWSLDQYFKNGNMNPDITGPDGGPDGKEDTREERERYLFDRAEELCDYIDENFISQNRYPEWAVQNDHFIIPADMRAVAKNYCYYLLGTKNKRGQLEKDIEARKAEMGGRVSAEEWADYQATREKYATILYDYLNNEKIPWRAPRYARFETSTETMYVDENGDATSWDDPNAREVRYSYGDRPDELSPIISPVDQGNYDLQGFTWDTLLDDNGRPISRASMESIYDQAAASGRITMGMGAGQTALDVMSAGGEIERGEAPVAFDERGWEAMDTTLPSWYSELDKATIDKKYGIDSYMPDDETKPDSSEDMSIDGKTNSMYNNRSYGGGSYYSSYSGGGGGGGYYYSYGSGGSNYNPKIYSTSKSVYSQRASGMRTYSPYKPTTSYLRPSFYTKGSREAYKRSDL